MNDAAALQPNVDPVRGGRHRAPTVLQMETTECGAACLGMVLARYGRWVPLEELRIRCGISRDGSKAASIIRAAREYDLHAAGYRRDPGRLFDLPFPMILFWQFNHFVVLEGIKGNKVYLNDPAEGPRVISAKEFDEGFTGVCLAFSPEPGFRTGGSPPSAVRGLLARLGRARTALFFVVVATLALVVPGLAIPTLSKVFVDDVLIPRSEGLLAPLLIGLGTTALLQGALTWLQQICLVRMEAKLSLVTTAKFFWHVVTLPMAFFGQRFAGDIANRVASNDKVAQLISGQLATNAINMLTMAIYATVMISYDLLLTTVAFVMAGINMLALRAVARARENGYRRLLKEQGKVAGASVNGVHMIETLKASGTEDDFFARWSGMHANALGAQQQLGLLTNLLNVVPPLLSSLTTAAILGVGGLRILDGVLTIGGLVAFQSLTRSFSQPIEGLVRFAADLQTVRGDIARLDDVLNYAPDEHTVKALEGSIEEAPPAPRGFITLDNVTFGYNAQEDPLIRDFTLKVRPGQRVALVGASGSGKSTVGRLICGLLRPWEGEILIDGIPVAQMSADQLVETVSYVDQDVVLFESSVRENVTLWNPTIEEQRITLALRDASVHDDIMSRPGKYDSPVEENGRNFSGGQRQRLEIARALATDPTILVLDEATAALDPLTELEIDDNLRRRGCTCLIVAHRLSTVRDADEIVVLERGHIVQQGTHEELIEAEGLYRNLITAT